MKSARYRGLLIAIAIFDSGAQLLLTPKPMAGEQIETKYRRVKKGVEKQKKYEAM